MIRKKFSQFLCLVSVIILLGAAPLSAREPSFPLSLTISGGVSLGAYQAGYIYYTSEMLRQNNLGVELKQVTGASAGAINSLMSILSVCSTDTPLLPKESLFWKTWTQIGIETLLTNPETSVASALFNTEQIEKSSDLIEAVWKQGIDKKCDVVLGMTTTLLNPENIVLKKGIQTTHQEEVFVLRIQGRGKGEPPKVSNYVDPEDTIPHALLYLSDDSHQQFTALKDLALASAAFPGAFPPRALRFCRTHSLEKSPSLQCKFDDSREALFIDGGVFDNQPLRLAHRTASRGLELSSGEHQWRQLPNKKNETPPSELVLAVLDGETKMYPGSTFKSEVNEPIAFYLRDFLSHFVSTARTQQLYSVLEEHPDLTQFISMGRGYFPLASEPLLAFFGFLDRGFREYDFYVGMYDARRNFPSTLASRSHHLTEFDYPEDGASASEYQWKDFSCLRGLLDQDQELQKQCVSDHARRIRLLAQLSYNRLYSNCRHLSEKEAKLFPNNECLLAAKKMDPPSFIPQTRWEKPSDRPDSLYALDFLIRENYPFSVLPPGTPSSETLPELKKHYRKALNQLAERQPKEHMLAMNWIGEPAFNLIHYTPSQREAHFLLGELIEGGGSLKLSPFFRGHASLSIHRIQDLFSSKFGSFTVSPMIGMEYEPTWINSGILQLRLGGRVGWQLTPKDSWGTARCESTNLYGCTRWAMEPYLSLSIYERFRLQLVERVTPASRGAQASCDTLIQLGFELTP